MPTCYWPPDSTSGYVGGVLGSVGDPNAQIQRQLIVAGGAHDGEVLARYGNVGPRCRWGANIPYDWINEHYVDAPCWWAPKARCRACASRTLAPWAVLAPACGNQVNAALHRDGARPWPVSPAPRWVTNTQWYRIGANALASGSI